jgi:hypothetical protein
MPPGPCETDHAPPAARSDAKVRRRIAQSRCSRNRWGRCRRFGRAHPGIKARSVPPSLTVASGLSPGRGGLVGRGARKRTRNRRR